MPDKKSVIILSGPVGAGKTTVAQQLVVCSPAPVAYIEGDKFWFFIVKNAANYSRNTNFKMIMTAMAAAAMSYALYGYEVVLDFSVPPWFLENARKMAKIREVPLDYVVLRPAEAVCAARAAARSEGKITDYAHYHDLYTSFYEAAQYTISDDTGTATAVAERIRMGLDAGKFRID